MKLINFYLITKDNTTDYISVEEYVHRSAEEKIIPIEAIVQKDFVAELQIEFMKDDVLSNIGIISNDVESLMNWVKENHQDVYNLIPGFRIDQFQFIADKMKSSSVLAYNTCEPGMPLDHQFGSEPDHYDFIPLRDSLEDSIKEIEEKGFYTEIQCYPDTPIGFWKYYGTDFQSLLDHLVKD